MAVSRYSSVPLLDLKYFGTPDGFLDIKNAINNGAIKTYSYITKPRDRLDTLAHNFFGDGRYWWIIAIANDIGWGLQITNGRTLIIPSDISSILDRI
tara:strand:+ start:6529 stop:6819 length:291 start_codon:yes stop_codon:yes gene_type:complete